MKGLDLNVLLAIGLFAVGLIVYYSYSHLKKKKKAAIVPVAVVDDGELPSDVANEMVHVAICDDTDIPPRLTYPQMKYGEVRKILKDSGKPARVWNRDGKRIYALHKTFNDLGEKVFQPLPIPKSNERSPRQLFNDMQLPEMEITHDMREDKNFLEKYGYIFLYLLGFAFLFFMWSQSV